GLFLVQSPPGERKSGMPHSVEIPAPVNGAMTRADSSSSCNSSMAVSRSGAIMYAAFPHFVFCTFPPSDAKRSHHEISATHAARAQPRSSARLLLQQARLEGSAPAGRREEPLHARVPCSAGGRRPRRGEQAHRSRRTVG